MLAALERAVDPDGDGDPSDDGAEVILLGVAGAFDGGGVDPVAQALAAADRVGATVVAPAGNDGPTFARPGVGRRAGGRARRCSPSAARRPAGPPAPADLDARVGPAAARLGPLPLMGPDPAGGRCPWSSCATTPGWPRATRHEDFRDAGGRQPGARRPGASWPAAGRRIAETGRAAPPRRARRALAVWDEDGRRGFPAVPGDAGWPIPVVGLGSRQGAALRSLAGPRARASR